MMKLGYGDVLQYAINVTQEEKTDVMVEYYGHVNCIEIRIYNNGWTGSKNAIYLNEVGGEKLESDEDDIHIHCEKLINLIKEAI